MANKWHQGKYTPKNPNKYVGKHIPTYRSGWELKFMRFCDDNPNVVAWASESHHIPYANPLKGETSKRSRYVPDFFIVYTDASGNRKAEFVEIKPAGQTMGKARSQEQKAAAIVNEAKWQAATEFATKHGVGFRVITENELFNNPKGSKKK